MIFVKTWGLNNMGIIKWFKENVLKIKSEKAKPVFKIKIVKTWFSDDWFNIKFSNNNGRDWEYIIDDTVDIFSPYDGLTAIKKDISATSIEDWARELNTYEKCRKHNDKIRENIEKTNEFRRKKYIEKRNKAEKFIKKFNDE